MAAFFLLFGLTLPLSKSVSSIVMGLIYLLFFAALYRDRTLTRLIRAGLDQPLTVPILLYMGMSITGLIYAKDLTEGLRIVKHQSNLLLIYLMVSVFIDSREDRERSPAFAEALIAVFVLGVFLLDLIGVMTYLGLIGRAKHVLPLCPLGMYYIWFGNVNAVALFSAASLAMFSRSAKSLKVRAGLAVFAVVGLISVLLSSSRAAWLGILFATVIFAYFLFENKKKFYAAVVSVLVLCVLLYVFNGIVHQRVHLVFSDISLFFSGDAATSIGLRFMMWKMSFKLFLSHPVFGVGTGGYAEAMSEYVRSGRFPGVILPYDQPHDMYLFALATNGILGLSALLYIFLKALNFSGRLAASDGVGKLFGFVALSTAVQFVIAGLTDSVMNIHVLTVLFAFVMGICERKSLSAGEGGPSTAGR
jgi:O-antigen ligase